MDSIYNFEVFQGHGGRFNINVSISKPGLISMTYGTYKKYSLQMFSSASLLYDKTNNVVAIKFLKEHTSNMFNIKHREDNKGGFIACKSFITAYELESYFGKKFVPQFIETEEHGKLMIIDLNKPTQ